jgi:AMMECR1 domain-containing protein
MSREAFLEQICCKAGLQRGSWRSPAATLYRFTADVFDEATIAM